MSKDNFKAKKYLNKGIDISISTVAVGILNILEYNFGHLWGHGKDEGELNEDEIRYRTRWKEVRTEILNTAENSKHIAKNNTKRLNVQMKGFYDDQF